MVAWQLRNNLLFFINNLQYYLQVDVLESQFATMMTTINNCRDFEVVQRAHTLFQANILSQSFLLLEVIFKRIDSDLSINRFTFNFLYMYIFIY